MVHTFKSEYYELPTKYKDTTVKLLVQSPTRMYAYWDVSDKVQLDPFANNYYIEVVDTDCDYQIELLRKVEDKSYLITSSNTTHIPRSTPCEYNDDIVFRNCTCLTVTDKFKIYTQNRENLKKYTDLPFDDDMISSMSNLQK